MLVIPTKGEEMFQLNLHRFQKTDSLKNELMDLAEEVQSIAPRANIAISLEPQSRKDGRRNKVFKISMVIRDPRFSRLVLSRSGEKVYPLIHALKKEVIRRLHQIKEKKITLRAHRTRLSRLVEPATNLEPLAG